MANSMQQYSTPLRFEEKRLSKVWYLNPRRSKPGRELIVCYDKRFPLADFIPVYSYVVRFQEKNNAAGNHYHEQKQEISVPLAGTFEVHLEDIETKEQEVLRLDADTVAAFYVKTRVAHKVVCTSDTGVLLVFASSHSDDADEIEYQVS